MDLHEQLVEHLGLESALTPEQAAQILVGAAGYARDALRTLERCTDPALDQAALRDLTRRATTIESHLRALLRLAQEHCDDAAVQDIPVAVGASGRSARSRSARRRSRARWPPGASGAATSS
jgi:hypothetical protein